MRVGIASKSSTQLGIMRELLEPMFGEIRVYDQRAIDSGTFSLSTEHVLIIDYSDDSIMELEPILEMLDKDEPKSILSEKDLYSLPHDERLGWRKKIVSEVKRLLPGLATEINQSKSAMMGGDIWVVGSSSGGPDALTNFISALPGLPISLILAQHIGSDNGSISLQKVLSSRQSNWKVDIAQDGMSLRPGYAYIVPRDSVVSINGERLVVSEHRLPNIPSPCINATLRSVRRSATGNMGIVILTGMGDDGAAALKEIKQRTIMVLAQDAAECAARSMPDAARDTGAVDTSATAVGLAKRIAEHYGVGIL